MRSGSGGLHRLGGPHHQARGVQVLGPVDEAGKTHVSEPERQALAELEQAGFTELTATHTPGRFTYWDYQRLAFPKNRGMRIDLAFGNAALAERLQGVVIDRDERKGTGASDHVPVVLDIEDR